MLFCGDFSLNIQDGKLLFKDLVTKTETDVITLDDKYIHSLTIGTKALMLYDDNKEPISSLNDNVNDDYPNGALKCDKKNKRIYWDDGEGNELWSYPNLLNDMKITAPKEIKKIVSTTIDPKTTYYIYNEATSQCLTYRHKITDFNYVYYIVTFDKCTNTPNSQWYIDGNYIVSVLRDNCLAIVNKTKLGAAGRTQVITEALYDRNFDIDIDKGTICSADRCLKTGGDLPVDDLSKYDKYYQWSFLTSLPSSATRCGKDNGSCGEGECCSSEGYCGYNEEFCGTGCQMDYGLCNEGRCGEGYNTLCPYDQCCSKDGYCGTSETHCGTGCQSDYGKCL